MSRTDKTDPFWVKVHRYGEDFSKPIFHCGCWYCKGMGYGDTPRTTEKRKWRKRMEIDDHRYPDPE